MAFAVRNIKSASFPAPTSPPCHFVTFPLSVNGEGEIKVAFDLLSVPSIRTVHRTVLISAPLESTIFILLMLNVFSNLCEMGPLPHSEQILNVFVSFTFLNAHC